jgi:hypothetical protein
MSGDRIDFISAYCDSWCERCAFTTRCSAYAVKAALAMCDGDFAAAVQLAVGAPPDERAPERRQLEQHWKEYQPTEEELAVVGRQMAEREERIDESALTTDAHVVSTLMWDWLSARANSLEYHQDRIVREAFEVAAWDCHLIEAKVHRALSGRDEAEHGDAMDDDPIQNDWNGSAKVALISMERSTAALNTLAAATLDPDAAAIAQRLHSLRLDVERTFPDAGKFVRPGFDDVGAIPRA